MKPHDETSANRSGNRPFTDVLTSRLSRRQIMAGGLAAVATIFIGAAGQSDAGQSDDDHDDDTNRRSDRKRSLLGFDPVPVADGGARFRRSRPTTATRSSSPGANRSCARSRLGGPGAGGIGGDAGVEHLAGGDVDEEQDVVAAEQGSVDGEEVAGHGGL